MSNIKSESFNEETVWMFIVKFPGLFRTKPEPYAEFLQPKSLVNESANYINANPQITWPSILIDSKVFYDPAKK